MADRDSGSSRERFRPGHDVRFHSVTDREQARLLTEPDRLRLFRPFLARERTVSQVAGETRTDLNSVLYRVRQYLAAGLLRIVREERRPGRPVKVYRSVHDAYFIPYEVTPFATLEERMLEQMLPAMRERIRVQARQIAKYGRVGQSLFRDELGEVWFASATDAALRTDWLDPHGGIDYWTEVWLTPKEALELREVLYAALERFGARPVEGEVPPEPGLRRFHFSVSTVPLDE